MPDLPITTPVDYTNRDYEAIRQAMLDRIPSLIPEWTSRSSSDFGIVLVELFAWAMDMLSYQTDRIINENFLDTASLRESVLGIASMLGYAPVAAGAAAGAVTFSIAPSTVGSVTIPAGTKVAALGATSSSPILFETVEELIVPGDTESPAAYSATVDVLQGETITDEVIGTSDGTINQRYSLFRIGVLSRSAVIDVHNGVDVVRWVEVSDIAATGPADPVYQVTVDVNGQAVVRFGDGFTGAVPALGADIYCTYRVGDGAAGNVERGAITQIRDTIPNVVAVTNDQATNGGEDAESLESIRRSAPKALEALNRAVTPDDYAALALKVQGVVKANAEAQIWSLVRLYVVPNNAGEITVDLEERIQAYLASRKMANAEVVVGPAVYVGVNVAVTLRVLDTHYQDVVERNVSNAIAQALSYVQRDFGEDVTLSLLYRAIHAVAGVDWATITLMVREDANPQSGVANVSIDEDEIAVLATNYSQVLELDATGGDFTLADGPAGAGPTAAIAYNASSTVLKSAIYDAGLIDATEDLRVTGSAGGPWVLTWQGALAGTAVPLLTLDDSGLTGGTGGTIDQQPFGLDISTTGGIA